MTRTNEHKRKLDKNIYEHSEDINTREYFGNLELDFVVDIQKIKRIL